LEQDIWFYVAVGFFAQLVDGAIGMAYGLISASVLLALGVAPAPASAAVHVAKIFTGAASGLSHWWLGNVDGPLCRRLILPGIAGGVLGATAVSLAPARFVAPVVAGYLAILGIVLVARAWLNQRMSGGARRVGPLAFVGGAVDAMGGGWGPVVTSTLIAQGHEPRRVIGSVNAAEFFVTLMQSAAFFAWLGLVQLDAIIGLVAGGVLAAPAGARLTQIMPARALIGVVGAAVAGLSARTLYLALSGQ
jgi:hypothetical protein